MYDEIQNEKILYIFKTKPDTHLSYIKLEILNKYCFKKEEL